MPLPAHSPRRSSNPSRSSLSHSSRQPLLPLRPRIQSPHQPQPFTEEEPRKPAPQAPQTPAETLGNAPIAAPPAGTQLLPARASSAATQQSNRSSQQAQAETPSGAPATDQQPEQQNLPPLHGPWIRIQREPNPPSPREEAEQQLTAIESGYSGWLGGTSLVNYRSGAPGYSQFAAIESPFEASAPLGYHARITAIAKPVFLDSGQANGGSNISVQESQSGASCLVTIPQPIGTAAASQNLTPCSAPPSAHSARPRSKTPSASAASCSSPFRIWPSPADTLPPVSSSPPSPPAFSGSPANGPFTLSFVRDSEKDSQLSYAGLRDPRHRLHPGQIWGGVVYNQGQVQFAHGDAQSGYYFAAGGQYLTGYNVEDNNRIDGNGGAYWRAYTSPEFGNLSVGANFFAMHYANNQNAFTHGMGGYFSPQGYFLGNIPVHLDRPLSDALALQHHGSASACRHFRRIPRRSGPLPPTSRLKPARTIPCLPNVTSVSANYDVRSQVAYQIGPHWFAGGYLVANNTRNYSYASAGFFVRYTFRQQPSAAIAPTGLFPAEGLRPFNVP